MTSKDIALYIHWPFCARKCPYCDFNVHVRAEIDHDLWARSYLKSLAYYKELLPGRRLSSVFFGGGTPSLMAPSTVEAILKTANEYWPFTEDCEITLEANPTSVETEKLKNFKTAGVNRVSLGVQALNDADLQFFGRTHDLKQALGAIETASSIFDRFSFDLMYARPDQTLKDWEAELKRAAALAEGGHLSLYQLTIERNTPFYLEEAKGKFVMPHDDLAADFYHLTQDVLEAAGMPAYEVSNHARPGEESRHNLICWRYEDYIGIGPGAHGRLTIKGEKIATREHRMPEIWLEGVEKQGHALQERRALSPQDRFEEALMMGLRLRGGVSVSRLEAESAAPIARLLDFEKIARMQAQGWMLPFERMNDARLCLTREGMLRLNALVPYLLRAQAPQVQA